jgi:hypothetical protein
LNCGEDMIKMPELHDALLAAMKNIDEQNYGKARQEIAFVQQFLSSPLLRYIVIDDYSFSQERDQREQNMIHTVQIEANKKYGTMLQGKMDELDASFQKKVEQEVKSRMAALGGGIV